MQLSPKLRKQLYFMIPEAGAQVGYSRAGSYRAADDGVIPTTWVGRYRLVPRKPWTRVKRQLARGQFPKSAKTAKRSGAGAAL